MKKSQGQGLQAETQKVGAQLGWTGAFVWAATGGWQGWRLQCQLDERTISGHFSI